VERKSQECMYMKPNCSKHVWAENFAEIIRCFSTLNLKTMQDNTLLLILTVAVAYLLYVHFQQSEKFSMVAFDGPKFLSKDHAKAYWTEKHVFGPDVKVTGASEDQARGYEKYEWIAKPNCPKSS